MDRFVKNEEYIQCTMSSKIALMGPVVSSSRTPAGMMDH